MDEDNNKENTINIPTYDIIITKINDREALWDVRHKALLEKIAAQDQANLIRFEGLNRIKETQSDLLNRCSTKDETKLAISEKSSELEIKLKEAQTALKEAIAGNVRVLESANNTTSSRVDTLEIYMKILIGGVVVGILILFISEYVRGV